MVQDAALSRRRSRVRISYGTFFLGVSMELSLWQTALLSGLIVLVLVLPLTIHKVEENLEAFLLACGLFAVTVSHVWNGHLVATALKDPIKITLAVLIAGLLFRQFNSFLQRATLKAVQQIGLRKTVFLLVFGLGLFSSLITAIVAALVLAELIIMLPLDRQQRIRLAVLACYAIGMGAVLTAIGEPLGSSFPNWPGRRITPDFFTSSNTWGGLS